MKFWAEMNCDFQGTPNTKNNHVKKFVMYLWQTLTRSHVEGRWLFYSIFMSFIIGCVNLMCHFFFQDMSFFLPFLFSTVVFDVIIINIDFSWPVGDKWNHQLIIEVTRLGTMVLPKSEGQVSIYQCGKPFWLIIIHSTLFWR